MELNFGTETLTFDGDTPTWTDGIVTIVVWEVDVGQWTAQISLNPGTYGQCPVMTQVGTYQSTAQAAIDAIPQAWSDNVSATLNEFLSVLAQKSSWILSAL